jgi:adenosylcobinamide-GDP ribazoletransferase
MSQQAWVQQRVAELKLSAIFLTRLPLRHRPPVGKGGLAQALWSAPIVGAVIGLVGAAVYGLAQALHLPALPAAVLAIAATATVTGGLHEDGLADLADGFGGGATPERKLAIMRDSRIGSYGVCALVLSFMLRVSALASISDPAVAAAALIAAQAAARAPLAAFMRLVPPARPDGMSAEAGRPPPAGAAVALLLGLASLVVTLGIAMGIAAMVLVSAAFGFLAWLCMRQIGGQTGDVLGALEQVAEIAVLLVAAAAWNDLR